ncbi:MAG: hypothetical protein FWD52_09320, partial [Candidatus Bathyarchaeota archaeon]|nr:hypothetical protein [Candidatus Termiticorpusculum sp.]
MDIVILALISAVGTAVVTVAIGIITTWLSKKTNGKQYLVDPQVVAFSNPPAVCEMPVNNAVNNSRLIHLPYQKNDYFTGRIDELAEIYENFQNKRWVYVTGMGGIG